MLNDIIENYNETLSTVFSNQGDDGTYIYSPTDDPVSDSPSDTPPNLQSPETNSPDISVQSPETSTENPPEEPSPSGTEDGLPSGTNQSPRQEDNYEQDQHLPDPSTPTDTDASDDKPVSKFERRLQAKNEIVRRVVNSTNFIKEKSVELIAQSAPDLFSPEFIKENIHSILPETTPLTLLPTFTREELTGIRNPYTLELEGARINEETGEPFTPEEADYFIRQRTQKNKELEEEYDKALQENTARIIGDTQKELEAVADKTAQDINAIALVIDSFPQLDMENPSLTPQEKKYANSFWKQVVDKYYTNVFDISDADATNTYNPKILKEDFNLLESAQRYVDRIPTPTPLPPTDKGVFASTGTSSTPPTTPPKTDEEIEFDNAVAFQVKSINNAKKGSISGLQF